MQVIGFNFSKISAEKFPDFKQVPITTNIEITDLQKEKIPLLKEQEAMKFLFNYSLTYDEQKPQESSQEKSPKEEKNKSPTPKSNPLAKIDLNGQIILSTTKEESKNFQDSWKKKQIPQSAQLFLYNIILRKSASKTLQLQEELGLPSHLPLPKIEPKN